jgi:hypothetical protein
MKPPHANPTHPAHEHYLPETDDYPTSEAIIERQWREQKGVDPRTGKAWLTPRMERNAIRTAEAMANDKAQPRPSA